MVSNSLTITHTEKSQILHRRTTKAKIISTLFPQKPLREKKTDLGHCPNLYITSKKHFPRDNAFYDIHIASETSEIVPPPWGPKLIISLLFYSNYILNEFQMHQLWNI